jgi:hypothetical protein
MAGIYDGYLHLTSLVDDDQALQSTLVLAGFSWDNLVQLSEAFVNTISWQPDQP